MKIYTLKVKDNGPNAGKFVGWMLLGQSKTLLVSMMGLKKKQKHLGNRKDESTIVFFFPIRNETDSSKTRQKQKSVTSQLSLICISLLIFLFQVTGLEELRIISVSS